MSMSKASIDLCGEDDPVVTFDPNATQDTLVIYNGNWGAAEQELDRWIKINPDLNKSSNRFVDLYLYF
jgi:hypothetical protein